MEEATEAKGWNGHKRDAADELARNSPHSRGNSWYDDVEPARGSLANISTTNAEYAGQMASRLDRSPILVRKQRSHDSR